MNDELNDHEIVPTIAVNSSPSVLSDLLEADDALAAEIIQLSGGLEVYKNFKCYTPRGFSLSLEEGADNGFLMKLLDAIIKFLVNMAEDISNGSVGINLSINRLISRAEEINTVSRSSRRTNKTGRFKVDTRIQNLCVNYRVMNDPQKLMMALKNTDNLVRKYFKFQDEELLRIIPSILTIRPTDEGSVERLCDLLSGVSPSSFANLAGFNDNGYNRIGPHLLGNQQLIVVSKSPNGDVIDKLIGQEFVLQLSDEEPKQPPPYIEYEVFARTTEQSILREVIATTNDLATRTGVMARMRRNGRIKELVRYLDVIRNDVAAGKYQGASLENATTFITLLESFNNWLVNPYLGLLSLTIRNMSAVLNVCEANN